MAKSHFPSHTKKEKRKRKNEKSVKLSKNYSINIQLISFPQTYSTLLTLRKRRALLFLSLTKEGKKSLFNVVTKSQLFSPSLYDVVRCTLPFLFLFRFIKSLFLRSVIRFSRSISATHNQPNKQKIASRVFFGFNFLGHLFACWDFELRNQTGSCENINFFVKFRFKKKKIFFLGLVEDCGSGVLDLCESLAFFVVFLS